MVMSVQQRLSREKRLVYWKNQISAWRKSGLSVKKYCQQASIAPSQFKYWQYQLAPETKRIPKGSSPTMPFVELKSPSETQQRPLAAISAPEKLTISTPCGYRIEVDSPSMAILLLRQLEQASC